MPAFTTNAILVFSSVNKFKQLLLITFLFFLNSNIFAQQARQTILFNDGWRFYKGDTANADKPIFNDDNWRQINLPHDWSIEGSFDEQWASATAYLPAGKGWYRKSFYIPASLQSKNIYVYFDGVYKNSEVWINGHYLGKRPNGFIAFQYELTKYLHSSGKNIIAVKVDHSEFADSRWYTGSGIYRNVYLVAENPVSIDLWGVAFTTPQVTEQQATANIAVAFTNKSPAVSNVIIKARLLNTTGKQVAEAQQNLLKIKSGQHANAAISFVVDNPSLWSINQPSLYRLEVSLIVQGKKTDEVIQQVGFRSFNFSSNKGFFLNGENIKLKGVCIHDDAGALGVAVPQEVWERRLQILKDGGCNSVRLSHNPHADYMYNLCDSMGFVVMDEAFDEWELGKNKWIRGWNQGTPGQDGYHQYFKEWADKDLRDMVLCNRNHPSIILWSIGNEIDYPNDPYSHPILNTGNNPQIYGRGYSASHPPASRLTEIAKQLVATIKKYDTTRPVTAALAGVVMSNEVGYPETLDVVGYNYQEFRYADDHKKYPKRVIYGSENGLSLSNWNAVANNDFIAGQYLWTGIDYMGEARHWPARSSHPGLIDLAGFKKPQYYFTQSLWAAKPMIYIGTIVIPKDTAVRDYNRFTDQALPLWNYQPGDSIIINCFTNCQQAELFINGKSSGKKLMVNAADKVISWRTVYQPGGLEVKGFNDENEVSNYTIKTAGEAFTIVAKADKKIFVQNKKQLAHIEVDIIDKNGNPVYKAANEITIIIKGPAILLGMESGSSVSHENYKLNKHKVLNGKLLAFVQSQQKPGVVKIIITSPGLQSSIITLPVN